MTEGQAQVRLIVNGERVHLSAGATVAEVLAAVGCGTRGVAVAVNSELVRRADWGVARLEEGDVVEVLHAVAGG